MPNATMARGRNVATAAFARHRGCPLSAMEFGVGTARCQREAGGCGQRWAKDRWGYDLIANVNPAIYE